MTSDATTIDPGEIAHFAAMAAEWWHPTGKFRPLHRLNPVRIAWIRDAACRWFGRDPGVTGPLAGLRLVDIGCGGGLLAEPMARLGAAVVGVDAAEVTIRVAGVHAAEVGLAIDYRCGSAEGLAAVGETFDIVLAMEVIEHVADRALFLRALSHLVRPGGMVVLSTLNRTWKSLALAKIGVEYVLRWLPPGTHDWRKFVKPSELAGGLRDTGLAVQDLTGVAYAPLTDSFSLDRRDVDVNYMLWAARS